MLDSLTLRGDEITDAGLAPLKGLAIAVLRIGGTRLTDAGLEQIRQIGTLRTLDLSTFASEAGGFVASKI